MTTNPYEPHPIRQGFAAGITMFAAVILLLGSILSILQGISAVADDQVFLAVPEYSYQMNLTTWGWVHIVLGIIGVLVAFGLMVAASWARVFAIAVAALSIIAAFLSLPYAPWWSVVTIILDLVVVWAISTWRPYADPPAPQQPTAPGW
ncbi:urea transporter [Nocardia transvalensis]|uniref:Urea transporter n=1 Tax=Nocardia transvalensis TaxID=37333 RepID=A0A7W9P8Q7_9NOCA|nr:hypothetical protein [Nocardia transvalensis]MBB5911219.1 urea transporter [Nocardia transvalensis]